MAIIKIKNAAIDLDAAEIPNLPASKITSGTFADARIADLSAKIENIIRSINLFEISKPIFLGNHGYTYVKCDNRVAKLDKIDYEKLKEKKLNKYFLIYSEKLLKRLKNEANILFVEKIK